MNESIRLEPKQTSKNISLIFLDDAKDISLNQKYSVA